MKLIQTTLALAAVSGVAFAQGADDCAMATAINGTGTFNFDNTGATDSGTTGLTCLGSVGAGADTLPADVWFAWTAPANGDFTISSCDLSPVVDTKIAVYDGDNCGTAMVVDCTDDTAGCGNFSSEVLLSGAISGNTYLVQIGVWAGQAQPFTQGAGQFEVTQNVILPTPANDECAAATAIMGVGPHAFDNGGATDSGSTGLNCDGAVGAGADLLPADVWFSWTAPASGDFLVSSCDLSPIVDTKIAVYDGNNCAGSMVVACTDDTTGCGNFSSEVLLSGALAGNSYLIQIGVWAGQAQPFTQGAGEFTVTQVGGPTNVGTPYCASLPNTSGNAASITAIGSESVGAAALELISSGMPNNVNGIFFYGTTQLNVPFGNGFRCVGGTVQRLPFDSADGMGVMNEPDVYSQPMMNLPIAPGTLNFQSWFRDPTVGAGFNLSDGLSVTFTP